MLRQQKEGRPGRMGAWVGEDLGVETGAYMCVDFPCSACIMPWELSPQA